MIPDSCPICAVYASYPHMRRIYDRQHPNSLDIEQALGREYKPKGPCFHLGKVKERKNCNCPFKFVHECEVHGRCTIGPNSDNIKSCFGCPDYSIE